MQILVFMFALYIKASRCYFSFLFWVCFLLYFLKLSKVMEVECNNKQIFHFFVFNIRNYSPEVTKNGMEYFFHYIPQEPNKKWVNVNKTQNISVTLTIFFFDSTGIIILKYLIIIVVIFFFCEITHPLWINRIRTLSHETDNFKGWPEIKSWNCFR